MSADLIRRKWIKNIGGTLIIASLILLSRKSDAKTNEILRAQLKYQSTPKDGMKCLSCLEFLPGKTDKDLGGCKLLPGDDEISPEGYCMRWNTM
jgi:hypothetical protein